MADQAGQHRCSFCNKLNGSRGEAATINFGHSRPRPPKPARNGRDPLPARPRVEFYAHTRCFVEALGEAALLKLPAAALVGIEPLELSPEARRSVIEKFRAVDARAARAAAAAAKEADRVAHATTRADTQLARDLNARCPTCKREPGKPCVSRTGRELRTVHPARRRFARAAARKGT